jgi:lysophospholipase L1-like esterase
VTFKGLSKDHYSELLSLLLGCTYEKFRACLRPEAYFERADDIKILSEDNEQKVMLVGASNLRHSVPHFAGTGACVIDHTIPGWTPSPENVAGMVKNIEAGPGTGVPFIFDLLGNSSLRFEQFDGTTALPFKVNGRFHYGGKVVITPPEIFQKTVENILPVLRKKGDNPGIIIPPLPRGLFSRCCNDSSHCTNVDKDSFAADLLTGFIGLRNNLIKLLVRSGLTNFKVLDSCCVTNCATTANLPERLEGLQKITLGDGTHFSRDGYRNLARRALDCIGRMAEMPRQAAKKKTYFWRGFRSPTGAQTARDVAGNQAATRVASRGRMRGGNSAAHRGHRGGFHPYWRW